MSLFEPTTNPARLQTEALLEQEVFDLTGRDPSYPFPSYELDPSDDDVINAWFMNHTIPGQVYESLREWREKRRGYVEEFNPFSFYQENQKDYQDIEPYLRDGYFNSSQSSSHFIATADSIRRELRNKELIQEGSALQDVYGMSTMITDPSTWIPLFGVAAKTGIVAKAVSVGTQVGTVAAIEEAFLTEQQRARSTYESMMAIGFSTLFGAGLGGMSALLSRKGKIMHPDHPDNPLAERNMVQIEEAGSDTYDPVNGLSMSEHIEEVSGNKINFDQSVTWERAAVERGVDWTQKKLGFTSSPVTVAAHLTLDSARNVMLNLAELGLNIKEVKTGKMAARPVPADLHKTTTVYAPQLAAEEAMSDAWYGLLKKWGHKREFIAKARSDVTEVTDWIRGTDRRASNPSDPSSMRFLSLPEFNTLVYRRASGDLRPHGNKTVEAAVQQAITGPHSHVAFYKMMLERLKKTGLLKESQELPYYVPQIWKADALIEKVDLARAAFKKKFSNSSRFEGKTLEEIDDFVEDLIAKLTNRFDNDFPLGMTAHTDDVLELGKHGRFERRELQLKPDELDDFLPFLETDMSRLSKHYADTVGGRLALREIFGKVAKEDELTGTFKSADGIETEESFGDLSGAIKFVREDYDVKRKAAQTANDSEKMQRLDRERILFEQATRTLMNRTMNTDLVPSRENWGSLALYAARNFKKINVLRYMGSPLIASQTDWATISLSHSIGPHLVSLGRSIGKIHKASKDINNRELAFLQHGMEQSMSLSRTGNIVGLTDAHYNMGFGSGKVRKVSAGIEAGLNWMTSHLMGINLMRSWNSTQKYISGNVILGNLLDDAAQMASGGTGKYRWRDLGLSDDMMKRIHRLTEKHGVEQQRLGQVFRVPDMMKWPTEKGGLDAMRAVHMAMKRGTDRAVITPSSADMPMFHSNVIGQMLFQFNSFGFGSTNKYLRNLSYRAVNGEAFDMANNIALTLALGTMSFVIKEGIVKGRFDDGTMPTEAATYTFEAIDRSGVIGWLAPYFNAAMKLSAQPLTDLGLPMEKLSRMQSQDWFAPILGPTIGGGASDVEALFANLTAGEADQLYTKIKRFVPFGNLFYVDAIMNYAEDTN